MVKLFQREGQQSLVGQTLNNQYILAEIIGKGAFGDVYRAKHLLLDREVAIKVLQAKWLHQKHNQDFLSNFDTEAKLTSRVNHPNAVTVYDYGIYDKKVLYLVMEFIKGQTLSSCLRNTQTPLSLSRIYKIVKQICAALSQAHSLGMVHRDLKPDNVMLSPSSEGEDWVKVLDFGIAKMIGLESQDDSFICGTPRYMSPEQCAGTAVDVRSDIYSLGVILYQMLSNKCHPFPNITQPKMFLKQHISGNPVSLMCANPDRRISIEINRVVMRCLEKRAGHRYASVIELLSDLKKAFFGVPVEMQTDGVTVQAISMNDMLDAYDTAHMQFEQGNYARAFEQMHTLIEQGVIDPQLIYLAILSLARSGAHELAMGYWQRYEKTLPETEANLALKARLLKDQYKQAMPLKDHLGIQAMDEYLRIAQLTKGYYPLINAATLAYWLGDRTQAQDLARQAQRQCFESLDLDYWGLVTQAEASLLVGELVEAEKFLQRAGELTDVSFSDLSTTHQQLELICQSGNIDEAILQAIKPPTIAHYTGHMVNGVGSSPGIDPDDQAMLREQAEVLLKKENIAIAYGSLACGADIIFAEAVLASKVELHVVLPFNKELFVRTSVLPGGEQWEKRFCRLLENASTVKILSQAAYTVKSLLFHLSTEHAIGLTLLHAEQLHTEVVQIAMYNGIDTHSEAGTAADIKRWQKLGYPSRIIETPEPRRKLIPPSRQEPSEIPQQQRYQAFIFAKIYRYSKISDAQLPAFTQVWVERFKQYVQPHMEHQESIEIWGDSVLLTMNDALSAAKLCTQFTQSLASEKTQSDNAMGLQIFMHAGLVFHETHSIFGKERFYGENMLKTEKMFLNIPVNSIYVSEEFAAQLIIKAPGDYRYCYAGQQMLPDDIGRFRLYSIHDALV